MNTPPRFEDEYPEAAQTLQEYYALQIAETERKQKFAGVGRNDKCPCGSGKKFKRCCL